MMKKLLTAIAAAAVVFALRAGHAADVKWIQDFEAAKKAAAKEGKDLLIDFTGSDWCIWCLRLKKEVFDEEAFKSEAPKYFILVELDFPRSKELPEKVRKQNEELAEKYGIQGFPTILLADPKGRVYARTGYQPGGAEKYVKHLQELRELRKKRDALFAKAEKAEGIERAKLLDEALEKLSEHENGAVLGYEDVIEEIVKLDADGKAGLKAKYVIRRRIDEIQKALQKRESDSVIRDVDALVKEYSPKGRELQQLLFLKAGALFFKDDLASTIKTLEEARKADPESDLAPRIAQIITQLKSQESEEEEN